MVFIPKSAHYRNLQDKWAFSRKWQLFLKCITTSRSGWELFLFGATPAPSLTNHPRNTREAEKKPNFFFFLNILHQPLHNPIRKYD